MARYRTVGELTASVRALGDFSYESGDTSDAYISDAIMLEFTDQAWSEAYDLIVDADPDRYSSDYSFTTTAGTTDYSLPADLYRLRGVDVSSSSGSDDWYTVHRYEPGERNVWQDASADAGLNDAPFMYKLNGTTIRLLPEPQSARSVRLSYVPTVARLTSSLQQIDGINGHEQLAVGLCLQLCKVRAQESTAEADVLIARQANRVSRMAADRDAGSPRRLLDPRIVWGSRRRRSW